MDEDGNLTLDEKEEAWNKRMEEKQKREDEAERARVEKLSQDYLRRRNGYVPR